MTSRTVSEIFLRMHSAPIVKGLRSGPRFINDVYVFMFYCGMLQLICYKDSGGLRTNHDVNKSISITYKGYSCQ